MISQRAPAKAGVMGGMAAAALLALGLVACGSAGHPTPHATSAAAPAATQSQSCASQVQAWAHDQGSAQLHQLSGDTSALSKDAFKAAAALGRSSAAGKLATWQAAATALETDAQAAAANPPPACADAADYGTAMQDYTTSAKDDISAVSDIISGGYTAAASLITSGTTAMQKGTSAIAQASAAVSALGG